MPLRVRSELEVQAQRVVETLEDLRRQHRLRARRGQLDRERDAVQPAADLRHRRPVLVGERERGSGVAGAVEVAGRTAYVTLDMSPGYGYTGIVIAMLAGLHPLGVVAASLFVAGVLVGADTMSRAVGVPTYIADVIVATSLIAVLVATLLTQYRVRMAK